MNKLNRYLITVVTIGWLSFLIAGFLISQVFAAPSFVLLVDRSYCPDAKWQEVTETYSDLHRQNQQQNIQIKSVIYVSDLGEEALETLPKPTDFAQLRTYGRFNSDRLGELQEKYPKAKILSCPQ